MSWYLQHFPTTESFLASGALLTGEASPGYIPYPAVANMVARRLPGPRIIAIGREPIDRAYSSYRYSYVTPTMDALRQGNFSGIKGGKPDEEYEQYLFSFEDMVKAELKVLRECFAPDGHGTTESRKKWIEEPWAREEYERRERENLPPMIDIENVCYGTKVNSTVLRKQWAELNAKYPEKVIKDENLHLTQSNIGRSLYTLPLEWWYANFPKEEIYFMCTEELRDLSGRPMNDLGLFLGLPSFNFSHTVRKGAFNVGGHRGFDREISWDKIEQKTNETEVKQGIPLSAELLQEVSDFVRPYNERLFELIGRRCDW
jgi:hypothetical protein